MTITIEQHIEELRAELRNAVYRDERRWIEEELARALEEREAHWADWEALLNSEPPSRAAHASDAPGGISR